VRLADYRPSVLSSCLDDIESDPPIVKESFLGFDRFDPMSSSDVILIRFIPVEQRSLPVYTIVATQCRLGPEPAVR
jgi:hypothetical protein